MVLDFAREFCNPQVGQGVMPLSGVDGKSMKNYRNSIQISPLTNRGEKKLLKFLRKACFEGQAVSFRKWFFNSIYIYIDAFVEKNPGSQCLNRLQEPSNGPETGREKFNSRNGRV